MITRRNVLATSFSCVALLSGGCTSGILTDSDEIDEKKERIAELQSELESAEEKIESQNLNHIKELYDISYEISTMAGGDWADGISYWDNREFALASVMFGRCEAGYDDAQFAFDRAATEAQTVSTDASNIASDSRDYCKHMRNASLRMANAAYYASYGEWDDAESEHNAAENNRQSAAGYSVESVQRFENALNASGQRA